MLDLTANAGTMSTKHRFGAEFGFLPIWQCRYFGRGSGVDQQLLNPCERLPDPDAPVLSKVEKWQGMYEWMDAWMDFSMI
jgi:hypothetical protein